MGSSLPCITLKCIAYFSRADTQAKFGSIDLELYVLGGKWKCACYRLVYVIFVDFIFRILLHEHRYFIKKAKCYIVHTKFPRWRAE